MVNLGLASIIKNNLKKNDMIRSIYHGVHVDKFVMPDCTDREKDLLTKINTDGFVVIPDFFTQENCKKCVDDINWMIENKKEFIQTRSDSRVYGAEYLSENIASFGNHDFLNKMANWYNGKETHNAFTLANKIQYVQGNLGSGEGWHRDSYARQFKAIVYLNNVDKDNGPFQILKESQRLSKKLSYVKKYHLKYQQTRFVDEKVNEIIEDNNALQTLSGKAGTLILVDTSAIHRGSPVKDGTRYALTNYYLLKEEITRENIEHFSPKMVAVDKILERVNS